MKPCGREDNHGSPIGRRGLAQVAFMEVDLRVFAFATLLSVATGILFGLLPAFRLSQSNLDLSLREGARGSTTHGKGLCGALLVGEVALAVVLLAGAGLLLRSFVRLTDVDPGYRAKDLLTAQLRLPPRYVSESQRAQFYDQLVDDIRHQGLDHEVEPVAYLNYRQLPRPMMSLVVKTRVTPSTLVPALRAAVSEVDPALPMFDAMTMDARLSNSLAGRQFNLLLLGAFAALALLLAGVGVYGVIAYLVSERTREVGIRMALGAGRREVVALVLRHAMKLALIGIGVGVSTAFGLTRLMATLLFEISPGDPLTFAAVSATLLSVALAAAWLPARRAAKVDPMVALRSE
jgi:hypothetical protein